MTHLERILDALKAAVAGSGWRVDVERAASYDRGGVPAVNIKRRSVSFLTRPIRPHDSLTAAAQVDLDIHWRKAEYGPLNGDAIDERVHRSIMADPTLGGLAIGVFRVAAEWDFADGDAAPSRITVRLEIHYSTRAGDLAVQG